MKASMRSNWMRSNWIVAIGLLACGSSTSNDAGADGSLEGSSSDGMSLDAGCPTSDASFACDISTVPSGQLTCAHWAGNPSDSGPGSTVCPAPVSKWTGSIGGTGCGYDWDDFVDMKPPDLCKLPSENGRKPFEWLHPTCDAGCP